ncbi:hypothetical protein [Crocinitomix catalasitica]|uniref:hypothetical protein n=1 Tax=Crocinitomix catalasitica TaxID=184607 RepID=UPI000484F7B1
MNYDAKGLASKRIVAKKNGKFGLINFKNEVTSPFQYEALAKIDYADLYKAKQDGHYLLIDQNKVLNPGPFDEISQFEDGTALTFKDGMMRTINKAGTITNEPVKMEPHEGYTTFEDLKYGLIAALESEDEELLKAFVDKIAPSEHLLYFLHYNFLSRKQLGNVDVAYVKMRYLEELTTFKNRYYKSILFDKKSLTTVEDYTIYDGEVYTNKRTTDHTFGNVKYLEKFLRNSFKVNGYWISPYFMSHRFR